MHVIRPINHDDLPTLETFSLNTSIGLTSLPPDRSILHQKILRSEYSFAKAVKEPGSELYQFVLEDLKTKEVVGTCAIIARVGTTEPLTFFRIGTEVARCEELGFCKRHQIIEPVTISQGPSEVCTLYLASGQRQAGLSYLLSLSRFLFIACFPERFHEMLIAQMRGVIDEHGHSPFYEAVTRPFFDVDFCELQDLLAMNRRFIFELLPHRPIYLSLLPKEAQAVVSQTHPKTAPALRLLEREGFKISRDLDLFDAGPKVECRRDEIRTVEHSVDCIVRKIDHVSVESDTYILSNQSINFRACLGRLEVVHPHEICIDPATAHALQVEEGDKVRYIEPRPKSSVEQSKTWQSANASV